MSEKDIPAEAAKKLEDIQSKYDIFFICNNKNIWDYFELNFRPALVLKVKENSNLPFTLINDLKKDFQVER
jgi:hypothetical protein